MFTTSSCSNEYSNLQTLPLNLNPFHLTSPNWKVIFNQLWHQVLLRKINFSKLFNCIWHLLRFGCMQLKNIISILICDLMMLKNWSKNQSEETWFNVFPTIEDDIWFPWDSLGRTWKLTTFKWQVLSMVHLC
jgi:hypothetical protein